MTVIVAAVTAQNSRGVRSVHPLPARAIRAQLQSVWQQVQPDAVCVGLVPDAAGVRALQTFFASLTHRPPMVVDPVLRASSGDALSQRSALAALKRLLPLATIVNPNVEEAARLSGSRIHNVAQADSAALALSRCGCAVLLTGHLSGANSTDILARAGRLQHFAQPRARTTMRGMGGILAAALSVFLARGVGLESAILRAQRFVHSALASARPLGNGKRQLWLPPRAGNGARKRSKERNL